MTYDEITRDYLARTRLKLRTFADALSKDMPKDKKGKQFISHGSVGHWKKAIHKPDAYKLSLLISLTQVSDWRHEFAVDMLKVIDPDLLNSNLISRESQRVIDVSARPEGGEK